MRCKGRGGVVAGIVLAALALGPPAGRALEESPQPGTPAQPAVSPAVQRDLEILNRMLRERQQRLNPAAGPPPAPGSAPAPARPAAAPAPVTASPSSPARSGRPAPDAGALRDAVERLADESAGVRAASQKELVAAGPAAVPALIDALSDRDVRIRAGAAAALGKIKDPSAVESLAELLHDPDEQVWDALWDAFRAFRKDAAPALIEALGANDRTARWRAAALMGSIRDPRFTEPLIETLNRDRATGVRVKIAASLGRIKDRRACEALLDALHDW